MENKNKHVRTGFATILWAVLAILLCTSPCGWAVTFDDGLEHDIDYEILDSVQVDNATVNLLSGAHIEWWLTANDGSTVNIEGGTVHKWVSVMPGSNVTVYGTSFTFQGEPHFAGEKLFISTSHPDYLGQLTVVYEDKTQVNLSIDCYFTIEGGTIVNYATVTLAAPGGDSITVNIEKAKVSWDHSDIHVYGKLYLPQGFWMDTLNPVGGVVTTLAGVEVANQDVEFELKGKKGDKWEYKDKENSVGKIKEFKIDWKGAKFDYKGDEGLHIHTHHIGGTETTLCIHCDQISGAFTVSVYGTTIAYDEERSIKTDLDYELQKNNNTHVHFTLPFQLTPDMTIEVSGAVELSIAVADYCEEGFVKFKLVSAFDPDSSSSDELEIEISLGEDPNTISGRVLIDAWTKKDDKHWDYK